jgi:hypothetical protein
MLEDESIVPAAMTAAMVALHPGKPILHRTSLTGYALEQVLDLLVPFLARLNRRFASDQTPTVQNWAFALEVHDSPLDLVLDPGFPVFASLGLDPFHRQDQGLDTQTISPAIHCLHFGLETFEVEGRDATSFVHVDRSPKRW